MPASLARLVAVGGIPALHCPATGRVVFDDQSGVDPDTPQSPHLRFFIDWVGNVLVARGQDLPDDQAAYQERLIRILSGSGDQEYAGRGAMIEACLAEMPESALVLEILDPAQGSFDGSICHAAFDLAPLPDERDGQASIRLVDLSDEATRDER